MRCTYCAFSSLYVKGEKRNGRKMPYALAKTLLDYLFGIWEQDDVKQVPSPLNISFYGGEPLMNYELIEKVVNYIEQNRQRVNKHITFSMTTNALLLPKHIRFLVDKQFNLLISLDGDEYGDSYRVKKNGAPSFRTVIRNVRSIQDEYPDYFKEHVSFNAVLTNRNSYDSIIRFFNKTFDKKPTISPLSVTDVNPNEILRLKTLLNHDQVDYSCLPLEQSPALTAFIREYEIKSGNAFYDFNELLYDMEREATLPTGTCLPFMKKMFLSARGIILPCEKIDHTFGYGSVDSSGVNLDVFKVAESYNRTTGAYDKQCSSCKIRRYCIKCAYLEKENPCMKYRETINPRIDVKGVQDELGRAMELVYSAKSAR